MRQEEFVIIKNFEYLGKFPKNIVLKHGEDEDREWYDFVKRRKAIVIKRNKHVKPSYFFIFIISGNTVRTLHGAYLKVRDAVKYLEKLGFKVTIEK